jgi:hypothetical protein
MLFKPYNIEKAHSCPLSSPLKISWSWRFWIRHTTMPKLSVLWLRMTWMELYIFNEHSRIFTAQLLSIVIQLTWHDPSWLHPTFYSKCWPKPIILSKTSGSFQNTWNKNLCHCLSCTTWENTSSSHFMIFGSVSSHIVKQLQVGFLCNAGILHVQQEISSP